MPDNNTNNNGPSRRKPRTAAPLDMGLAHMPPQSVETERTVLGALMIDKDAFTVVSEILRPETFYEPRNQKVFAAIQTLSIKEQPVDLVTVTEQLKRDGTLEEVGGQMYIYELTANVASAAHVEFHARILAQKFLARQLIHFASIVETNAFDESNDIELVMQEAEGKLFELSQKNMRLDYTQIDPVVKQAVEIMQRAASNTGGLTGVPSGFTKLDDMTSGWQKSDLIIIAGRPAMGKTSFALSIAKNVAIDQRIPVAFFSLEMNNVQLVNRLISNTCEIEGKKVMNGQLDDADWDRFDRNIRKLEGAPLYVDETPGLSIFELRTKARRLAREKKVELIMIDYLQLMNANGMRFGNRQEEVSTISRSLKQLAKELDIPILALSQLNRSVEQRGDAEGGKRPQLSDLRESGAIEQDADMVLFVHRPEYYHILNDEKGNDLRGMAQIIIAKHRKGAVGDVLLNFRGEYTRFANPEDTYMPPTQGGEIMGSRINGGFDDPLGPPPPPESPF
ncbi:MAG: replicative DNA helicase [Prevotella sp.]|nr:replicative DNA helicase [Prevotella sp.]